MSRRKTPDTAMVLAAGLGTRLRPLTDHGPKALVEVGGKALIDHVLDRLAAAGIARAVINVHAFADRLEAHVRGRPDLEVIISDERGALLETGGGLRKARSLLGAGPILVSNIDTLWTEEGLLDRLIAAWDPKRMDDLLAVIPMADTLGFGGPGDFFMGPDGRLSHRGEESTAPLAYMGVHMLDPALIEAWPDGRHGVFEHWMGYAAAGRLHGLAARGLWMHVGDPAALAAAEARLAGRR
ncbi:MAG TPA: nucleotidyltransferase family protein [Caulobacteraceae bacterium]|nr:nucleotidyltransferase family protein [Caulobacteraceae bacterium]